MHFIIGTLYIALPLLFLILMSWAGLKVSNAVMAVVNDMSTPSNAAGQEGGAIAKEWTLKGITNIIKLALKK